MYQIKKVKLSGPNIKTIRFLNSECFLKESYFKIRGIHWWLAYKGDEPIGFAGCSIEKNGEAVFHRTGILFDHRGHGLQRKFIRECLSWASAHGAKYMTAYCTPENVWSANNFIKEGFLMYQVAPKDAFLNFKKVFS
jgi:GNAT superfamily N-acetyltransferase